jgi:pimeloyl-ACP methyl ester carboxylesterase
VTAQLELLHTAPATQACNKPALLFVHGAFCGAWCWQDTFMPWFAARGFDCWALSLEGHAGSAGHAYLDAISIEDYRRNLASVIKDFDHPPIVIGHSMGGFVLQQYLCHAALPGAVFLASVPPTGMAQSSMRMLLQAPSSLMMLNLYQQGQYQPGISEVRNLLFSPETPEQTILSTIQHYQPESQRAVMDMAMVNPLSIHRGFPTPALVLGAGLDQIIATSEVHAMARHMGVTAEIIPHMGHMMMLDTQWQQVAQCVKNWLDRQQGE